VQADARLCIIDGREVRKTEKTAARSPQRAGIPDGKLGWHPGPSRQLVITLSGGLQFTTHDGRFSLRAGDILFTEDTVAGHDWTLLGDQPWRRVYAILDQVTIVPFRAEPRSAIASRETRTAKAATTTGEGT
jgi:hypothetical protein